MIQKTIEAIEERYSTPVVIALVNLYTFGALIIIAGGIVLIILRRPDIGGMDAITFGFSILALGFASLSGIQMRALTHLNFDEKMAMMVIHNTRIIGIDTEKPSERSDNLDSILDRCKYDLQALSHLRYWAKREEKEDLIDNYVVEIINNAQRKDTCKNNRKKLCELIEISLKIVPKHHKLGTIREEICPRS
jgi:hypothetical protein